MVAIIFLIGSSFLNFNRVISPTMFFDYYAITMIAMILKMSNDKQNIRGSYE